MHIEMQQQTGSCGERQEHREYPACCTGIESLLHALGRLGRIQGGTILRVTNSVRELSAGWLGIEALGLDSYSSD
jgi:hypothetical protein